MINCADRMVLAWRFAPRMTAEDLAEMLREAVFQRFGEAGARARGIEFLSDNGPEYTSHRFRPFVQAMGLIPCHTPRRSPESNGLVEAFFGSFKRDYVYQACLETLEAVGHQLPAWIEPYNREAPHSAFGRRAQAEFYAEWMVKNKTYLSKFSPNPKINQAIRAWEIFVYKASVAGFSVMRRTFRLSLRVSRPARLIRRNRSVRMLCKTYA